MEVFEGQPRDLDEGPGLLQSVWQYKWLIAIAALLGALLAYGWEARKPTLYEGSTRLVLSIGNSALPGDSEAPPQEPQRFLSNQAQMITSRSVLQRAAKGRTSPGSLRANMTLDVAVDADVITIRVRDPESERAARLAEEVGKAYHRFVLEQSSKAAADQAKQLEVVAREHRQELQEIAVALQKDPDDPILQASQRAVRDRLNTTVARSQTLADRAKFPLSPVQLQESAAVPTQPIQPTPRRAAAAGLLLGLVGSAAMAWWLNIRATKQQHYEAGAGWTAEEARRREPRAIGGNLQPVQPAPWNQEWAEESVDAAPAAGNGAHRGAIAPLVRSEAADAPAGGDRQDLRGLFVQLEATFGRRPLDWYLDNSPQFMAEQLTMRVSTEIVAILLDNGQGSFVVAGGFGMTAEEEGAIAHQSHDVLRQALAEGVGVFQDGTGRMPSAAAGLPGSQSAQALVMVPLVYGPTWLGMLIVGRRSANGHRVVGFDDQEIEHILVYALEISPMLQTLMLLDRLQASVQSLEKTRDDHAKPAPG